MKYIEYYVILGLLKFVVNKRTADGLWADEKLIIILKKK